MRHSDLQAQDLLVLLRLPIALLGLAALLVLLAPLWWMAELATHFCAQLLVLAVLCALSVGLFGARQERPWLVLAVLSSLVFAHPFARAHAPVQQAGETRDPSLRLLHFNVHTANRNKARAVEAMAAAAPDLIVVQEVNQAWLDALREGLPAFRVLAASARADNFGIAVLARAGLDARAELELDAWGQGVPTITVQLPGLELLAVHTLPPISFAYARRRNAQLAGAAQWSADREGAARVVVGDLNVSVYSPEFRALLVEGELIDGRRSAGVFAHRTFPAGPLGLLLGIPIDHVVHGPGVRAESFEVAEDWGSDHRAVTVALRYPSP